MVLLVHRFWVLCLKCGYLLLQIGLAVGDIEAVQRNARLKRLAMQVCIVHVILLDLDVLTRMPVSMTFLCTKILLFYLWAINPTIPLMTVPTNPDNSVFSPPRLWPFMV